LEQGLREAKRNGNEWASGLARFGDGCFTAVDWRRPEHSLASCHLRLSGMLAHFSSRGMHGDNLGFCRHGEGRLPRGGPCRRRGAIRPAPVRIYLDLETEGGAAHSMTAHSSLVQQIAVLYAGNVSEEIFRGPAVPRRFLEDRVNVHVLLEKN